MKISIVTTLYHSAQYIIEFVRRSSEAARQIAGSEYEIILVNDGSPDDSLQIALDLLDKDHHLNVIDLSRNFGHHKAMMTGLAHATGDKIFLIDSDLEEDPQWLVEFHNRLVRDKCDVVYGVQERRKGNFFERWSGHFFYRLHVIFTGVEIPANVVTARIMSRGYVDALLQHKEREIFIAGLWKITGFSQCSQKVVKHNTSETTYTFLHKMAVLVNSITSFSNAPLIGIFKVGFLIFVLSLFYTGYLVVNWLFFATPLSGWTSLMASIWLMGGLIISFIGVIGIYLSKIYSETKQRPYTIIRQIYDKNNKHSF